MVQEVRGVPEVQVVPDRLNLSNLSNLSNLLNLLNP